MRKSSALLAAAMLSVSTMLPTQSILMPPLIGPEIYSPYKRPGKRRRSRAEVRGW